jgi:hypothetical protein
MTGHVPEANDPDIAVLLGKIKVKKNAKNNAGTLDES